MVFSQANGKTELFGGTSAAQPVVTGCVLNALSMIPDLTSDEMKLLLVRSAIQTPNANELTRSNGAGTLNCYKLMKVADRVKNLTKEDRITAIHDLSTYDFTNESSDLKASA